MLLLTDMSQCNNDLFMVLFIEVLLPCSVAEDGLFMLKFSLVFAFRGELC